MVGVLRVISLVLPIKNSVRNWGISRSYLGRSLKSLKCEKSNDWFFILENLSRVLVLVCKVCAPLLRVLSITCIIFLRESLLALSGRRGCPLLALLSILLLRV